MSKPFNPGDRVYHRRQGRGTVHEDVGLGSQDVSIYVEFDDAPDQGPGAILEVSMNQLTLIRRAGETPTLVAPEKRQEAIDLLWRVRGYTGKANFSPGEIEEIEETHADIVDAVLSVLGYDVK